MNGKDNSQFKDLHHEELVISRRDVLWMLAGLTAVSSAQTHSADSSLPRIDVCQLPSSDLGHGILDLQFRRSADFAFVRFRLLNAKWKGGHTIEKLDPSKDLTVTVWFPPQHLLEQALLVGAPWPSTPVCGPRSQGRAASASKYPPARSKYPMSIFLTGDSGARDGSIPCCRLPRSARRGRPKLRWRYRPD